MNREGTTEISHNLARSEARELMDRMDDEPHHALQVCRLAMALFDQLSPLHGLGDEERLLLECAALLHDIGWTTRPSAHHKGSRDAILAESFAGFDSDQRLLIALLARYHRKSHPRPRHTGYGELPEKKQRVIRVLASLLRIADGLDRSHTDNVRELACTVDGDRLRLRLVTRNNPGVELYGLQKKTGLFEEEFGLSVCVEPVRDSS